MSERVAIGLDLGGTKLAGALVDESGAILARREQPTPAREGPGAVISAIAALANDLAGEARAKAREVAGAGLGAPGPLDPATGVVHAMPNLGEEWRRFPLGERLREALGGTSVHLENDANAAMQGEAWIGAAAGARDAVLLTLGTGVGGGIVASGLLVRGSRGAGAELGHVVVEREGRACGCGGRGCLEQYSSGTALARQAGEALARSPGGALAALGRAPTGEDVVAAARKNDELALSVIEAAGRALGVGLTSIVHALNPRVIVLGGGMGTAAFDLLEPIARRELFSRTFEASREGLSIARAKLGPDAGIVGAARSVFLARARAPERGLT
ncbi:ROK family protein [bacterium]|nr:ROK family protein [bacterium]